MTSFSSRVEWPTESNALLKSSAMTRTNGFESRTVIEWNKVTIRAAVVEPVGRKPNRSEWKVQSWRSLRSESGWLNVRIRIMPWVVIVTVLSAAVIRRSVVWQTDANNSTIESDVPILLGNWIDSNRNALASIPWSKVLPKDAHGSGQIRKITRIDPDIKMSVNMWLLNSFMCFFV